jgi:serine/threonine protein kinase/Tfp pilus assembly protein PilF
MSEPLCTDPTPAAGGGSPFGTIRTRATSLLDDQNLHWLLGERVLVEDYLAREPALHHDSDALLDLIYNEIRLREESGEAPGADEYRHRFPELEELLRLQFEVHHAMRPGQVLAELELPDEDTQGELPVRLPAISGYEVQEELGRGAMGVVYKARHLRLNRFVAVKMILTGSYAGQRDRSRFNTEAQAVARLQHPHIVQIHEVSEQDGTPFFSLEYVAGGSLAQKLAGKPLPSRTAALLVETLARAVQHAHEQGIIHRDLKPANVLLAPSDALRGLRLGRPEEAAWYEPKITDFGLARLLDPDADRNVANDSQRTEGPVGTPPYMAPEQAGGLGWTGDQVNGASANRSTDVYALGAILYEALTGRPPFIAATALETLQQVQTLDPVPPRRLQPQVPRDLETICLACLRKDPTARYASALDLADDLRRFLDGKPIRQRPAAFWEPAAKWARRRPAAAAWVVLGIVAILGAVAGGLYWLQHREEWARQRALDQYQQFLQHRDDAFFQATLRRAGGLTSPDEAAASAAAAQEAARKALALAGVALDTPTGPVLDPWLSVGEQEDVRDNCSELLLVLADAVALPRPGQTDAERQEQTGEAIRILERAAHLHGPTRAHHLMLAHLLAQRGQQHEAEAERARAEALRPASASDCYRSGVQYYREGNASAAERSLHEALRLRPNHFEARCFLAVCALNAGRPEEAQVGLTACIGQRPRFAWAYLLRGQASVNRGAFTEAEADFAAALQLDSCAAVRYAVAANCGVVGYRLGKLEQAAADLDEAIRTQPTWLQAHVTLAQVYQKQKKWKDAARELDIAVQLAPNEPAVYRTRAHFHRDREDRNRDHLAAALRDFDRAIALELPTNVALLADDHVERGRIHHDRKAYLAALQAFDDALRVRANSGRALRRRGLTLMALRRYQEAERSFDKCIEQGELAVEVFSGRGSAREKLGNLPGAIDDYTQSLQHKRDAEILHYRGWAHILLDAWKLALRDFDDAIRLDPRRSDAYIGRGLARVMLGDYRRAVADAAVVQQRQKKPDTPVMMHNLACLFAQAVARVKADTQQEQEQRAALEARYRRQAIEALRQALLMLPRDQRLAFWQDQMRPDRALDPIRTSAAFSRFDQQVRTEYSAAGEQGKNEGTSSSPSSL